MLEINIEINELEFFYDLFPCYNLYGQLSSESPSQKSSQVQRKSQKESRTWTLLTLWSSPPPYNLMHSPYNLMHHLITSCTTHTKLFIYAKISLFEQHAVQKVENIIE